VIPDLSLYNTTFTPVLRDKIISAQKNDEGMTHSKRKMEEGDPKVPVSTRMWKVHYGSRIDWLCQRKKHLRRRFWIKPIP
jgi:hypothetical protein